MTDEGAGRRVFRHAGELCVGRRERVDGSGILVDAPLAVLSGGSVDGPGQC